MSATVPTVVTAAPNGPEPDESDAIRDPLDARESLFVDAIAEGQSLADSAKAADVSYRTGRRWRLRPHVAEAIRNRTAENLAQARAILSAGTSRAARALVSMADGKAKASSARVASALGVLNAASKLAELEEFTERLTKLEEQIRRRPS